MTRKEFLTELDHRLSSLPRREADEYLNYYAEMLADHVESGMTDDEAVASMESLDTITARILGASYTTPVKKNRSERTVAIAAVVIIAAMALTFVCGSFLQPRIYRDVVDYGTSVPVVEETTSYDEHLITVPADGIRRLEINWVSGSVCFQTGEGDEIELINYSSDATLRYTVEGDTLTVRQFDDDSVIHTNLSGDLFVTIPYSLAESGLDSLSVAVTSAELDLCDINAGELAVTSISGGCIVDGRFGNAVISTTSGEVFFSGSFADGMFNTVSGNLYVTADDTLRSFDANSVSGEVSLSIPADTGFTLEFDSVSGRFYSGSFSVRENGETYTCGDGSVNLSIDTISGDLTLSEF